MDSESIPALAAAHPHAAAPEESLVPGLPLALALQVQLVLGGRLLHIQQMEMNSHLGTPNMRYPSV